MIPDPEISSVIDLDAAIQDAVSPEAKFIELGFKQRANENRKAYRKRIKNMLHVRGKEQAKLTRQQQREKAKK